MDMIARNKEPEIPTIPSDIIEEDILTANKPNKSDIEVFNDSEILIESSPIKVQDELFQVPKLVPRKKPKVKSARKVKPAPAQSHDNSQSRDQSVSKRKGKDLHPGEMSLQGDELNLSKRMSQISQHDNDPSLRRLKRHLKSNHFPSVQEMHEIRAESFMNNLNLECDVLLRPLNSKRFRSHLKSLSRSSLQVAQNITDPISLKRAYFDQHQRWHKAKTLDILADGFYAPSFHQLSPIEFRNMSTRLQRIASSCATTFSNNLSNLGLDDKDILEDGLNESVTFAKLEETGQQIYRQMIQYMNFVASSKAVTKSENSKATEKIDNSQAPEINGNIETQKMKAKSKMHKSLFPINTSDNDRFAFQMSQKGVSAVTAHSFSPPMKKFRPDFTKTDDKMSPEKTAGGKEDGELSDGADSVENKSENEEDKEGDSDEAPFQIKVKPKAQSADDAAAESSDKDSENGSKKKKKKRKKSKSSATKKERKKKKKDKKSKEKSPDDLPKAYAMNRNEERASYRPMNREQSRPFIRRGFHQYHQNRGGFRNFRYQNNFRMRGRGNWRPMNNPMHRNFNNRYQRPAGMFSHQRMLREKQFVSESESEDDMRSRKRIKSSSPRKSISETEKSAEKTKRRVSESTEVKEIVIRDESDADGSALNMLSEYN